MKKKKRGKRESIPEFFKRNYLESWDYIKESRNFIFAIVGIFIFAFLTGFLLPVPEFIADRIGEVIKELLEKTEGMGARELTQFIFLNNSQASLFGLVLGVFLGIFPVIVSIINGYLIGFVASVSVQNAGIFSLWRLFPHGIFELPAVFISLGLGLKLGTFVFRKKIIKSLKEYSLKSVKVFVFVVIPLLIVAAIIEGLLIVFFS